MDPVKDDERISGDGNFVEKVLKEAEGSRYVGGASLCLGNYFLVTFSFSFTAPAKKSSALLKFSSTAFLKSLHPCRYAKDCTRLVEKF